MRAPGLRRPHIKETNRGEYERGKRHSRASEDLQTNNAPSSRKRTSNRIGPIEERKKGEDPVSPSRFTFVSPWGLASPLTRA